uniref:Gfo/Idh/MocA-like oxidoreductase N-terminal domain-containing protein n=1 Tax=Schizophyllum commune (strain H4-8 / FGSC 9210) TaxID=578458 RepID=D8QAW7_SCHCM
MSSQSQALGGRVAVVGCGSRAAMFVRGVVARASSQVVAFCEPNSKRAAYYNDLLTELGAPTVSVYLPDQFEEMLSKEKVEIVVITCVDALHDLYIVPALKAGVKVLTEKPMTTDIEKCRRILQTVKDTNNHVTVAFNYRQLVKLLSVHFEWLLDTVHGADYFRRWHRQKTNSGGLMVHKSGHHFDLVNWWINSEPEAVAGMGKLGFYGEENGKRHGWARDYVRARGSEEAKKDPFAIHLEKDDTLKRIYADAEEEDGYHRDQNVFAPDIGIEDDMGVMVRYKSGAIMTYHLVRFAVLPHTPHGKATASPSTVRTAASSSTSSNPNTASLKTRHLGGLIHGTEALPRAGGATRLPIEVDHSAHGGGDTRMLNVLFGPLEGEAADTGDAAKQGATERDGAMALVVGLLANESFKSDKFMYVKDLNLPL